MTKSYEVIRNEYCHEILSAMYFHSTGVARESTVQEMQEGKEGRLLSDKYFPNFDLKGWDESLGITDVLLQDVCEYLESNGHIEGIKTNKGIFEKTRFTKAGVIALKRHFYIKENKKLEDEGWIRRSTLFNNFTTPFIALAALIIAINECNGKSSDKTQIPQQKQELVTSETQPAAPAQYRPTNSTDTIPKLPKVDSNASPAKMGRLSPK